MARAPSAARLFNQLELEEVEAAATKDELERSAPLLTDFEAWLRAECARLSRSSNLIKPINYLLNRWNGFARFVYDGRICLTNLLGLDEGVVKRQKRVRAL